MTKEDEHQVIDLRLPESVLLKAKEMAAYVGLSLEEFIVSAIGEKLVEEENVPSHAADRVVQLRKHDAQ